MDLLSVHPGAGNTAARDADRNHLGSDAHLYLAPGGDGAMEGYTLRVP